MLQLAVLVASVVTVGMWVYRVNANAQAIADGLSITPGWNVGWFFIPFANLWKPFEGMKETWQASHDPADWAWVPVPALLRIWWGTWIATNVCSNVSFQLQRNGGGSAAIDIAASAMSILAAVALIQIMRDLARVQAHNSAAHVFA